MTGLGDLPLRSVPGVIRSMLLATSRPIYPRSRPKVVWNGQYEEVLDSPLDNSTWQPVLQLVQNATVSTGIANMTEGQASVA